MSKNESNERRLKIGIVGAGVSGICTGIQLQDQLGIHDYVIFDERHDVGGVWLVNTYPGCACDVPSHFYSFSFEQNPNWSESFSAQAEILEYLKSVARKHDLYKKIKFKHQVKKCVWDEKIAKWRVLIQNKGLEKEYIFDIMISCLGGLRVPQIPAEFDAFKGPKMHSALWDDKVKLNNKKVAIVGTGASAVQIIPKIVDSVKTLTVYQRRPPWVVPRMQFSFPNWAQWAFAYIPGVQTTFRSTLFWLYEMTHAIYMKESTFGKLGERFSKHYLKKEFKRDDEKLQQELIPKYNIGCKRITPSDEYYDSLSQPNVNIITSKITKVNPRSIVTEDGHEENIDILILATGFKVQDFFSPLEIIGKDSVNIMKLWKSEGPSSYLGMTSSTLPNCFFVVGPNSSPGHTSNIFTIECQVNWIIKVLREVINRNSSVVTVDENVEKQHMQRILSQVQNTVWSEDCGSYWRDHRGVVTALIPDSGFSYWRQTRSPNFNHLIFN